MLTKPGNMQLRLDAPLAVANESAPANTIARLLREQAAHAHDASCILSATGQALAWRDLLLQLDAVRAALRLRGIAADHRVALVMPNGPTLAVAFLAVSSAAACAPLNPSYSADEFAFYLDDLKSRALIVSLAAPEAAAAAAARLGIPVLKAVPDPAAPGLFDLSGPPCGPAAPDRETVPDDVALLLHTSGTTSRPKVVPLRQCNLIASSRNMVRTLELGRSDRCLNLMPLFHIHGLVGGLLAPLAGGGSAACPPPFRPDGFLRWLSATDPTWYTAVPTMHRAIATEAASRDLVRSRLRFIRSSSAPLPAALFDELSHIFRVPVVEAYSMTEAAHQMTCNPLTPGRQKPGTVGLPAGPDVALLDDDGHILPAGAVGEIAIRGPSVIDGYEANPKANVEAFVDGWFRTGDQGRFDAEGYLVLTGRLKEQINRGGEKISPLEIDQVLLRHPEVAEAVAFGFPHPSLGEEIAAVVVLRPGARAGASDLHSFLHGSLAPFKTPKRILVLEQIPKGPTGKIQRRQMAKLLDMDGDRPREAAAAEPRDALEADLLALWRRTLRCDDIGPDDDFLESGGDSLTALGVVLELEQRTGRSLPESMLLDYPTVRRLARGLTETGGLPTDPLVRVQPHGKRPPIFFFDGDHSGGYYTRGVSRLLGDDQPFFSIPPHDARTALPSFEAMADDRLALLLGANPDRPFRLAGYCNGGMVAIEVARRLVAAGRQVELVAMIDTPPLNFHPWMRLVLPMLTALAGRGCGDSRRAAAADMIWRQMSNLQLYSRATYALALATGVWRRIRMRSLSLSLPNAALAAIPESRLRDRVVARDLLHAQLYTRLFRRYVPGRLDVPVVYYSASYRRAALRGLEADVVPVPGGHWGCITTHAQTLVDDWRRRLEACDRRAAVAPQARCGLSGGCPPSLEMPGGKITTNRSRLDRYIAENVAQTVATLDQCSIERYDQFADHLPAGAINVLDVGCAEGRGGAQLKMRRPEIVLTGLDCVPERLRALPPAYSGRIEGLTTEIPLPDRSEDAVVAGEFIEHLYPGDVDQTLCEFQRILAVGGMLLMTTPNPDSLKLRLRRGTVLDVGHFTQHFHDVLSLRLRLHGFRRVKVRGSGKATRYFGEKIPFLSLYGSYLITALKI